MGPMTSMCLRASGPVSAAEALCTAAEWMNDAACGGLEPEDADGIFFPERASPLPRPAAGERADVLSRQNAAIVRRPSLA
jgi:hypothetical protein